MPHFMTFERQFRLEQVTALVAFQLQRQMRRHQMHLERPQDVESLLAQIALQVARVLMLQHVLAQVPGGGKAAAARIALEPGSLRRAVNALHVLLHAPFQHLAALGALGGRGLVHVHLVIGQASVRFGGEEAAVVVARERPPLVVRLRVRIQPTAFGESGAALGAHVRFFQSATVALDRVFGQFASGVEQLRAAGVGAGEFGRRVA